MTRQKMIQRTKRFAVDAVRFCAVLPRHEACRIVGRQLMRSATSVGANYRAAQRGRTKKEFVAKLGIVEEEADETLYWLEILDELAAGDLEERQRLHQEANELVAIVVAAKKTARTTRT